jgi:hypothetical protein
MERENKPQNERKMGLNCSFFFALKTIMEDKNKAAASAQSAKGGKRLQRKPQIGWSAVGPWNQNTTGYK